MRMRWKRTAHLRREGMEDLCGDGRGVGIRPRRCISKVDHAPFTEHVEGAEVTADADDMLVEVVVHGNHLRSRFVNEDGEPERLVTATGGVKRLLRQNGVAVEVPLRSGHQLGCVAKPVQAIFDRECELVLAGSCRGQRLRRYKAAHDSKQSNGSEPMPFTESYFGQPSHKLSPAIEGTEANLGAQERRSMRVPASTRLTRAQ